MSSTLPAATTIVAQSFSEESRRGLQHVMSRAGNNFFCYLVI